MAKEGSGPEPTDTELESCGSAGKPGGKTEKTNIDLTDRKKSVCSTPIQALLKYHIDQREELGDDRSALWL
jgi:hypothetical protein